MNALRAIVCAALVLALPAAAQVRIGNLPSTNRLEDFRFAGASGSGSAAPARLLAWSNLLDEIDVVVTNSGTPSNALFLTHTGGVSRLLPWSSIYGQTETNILDRVGTLTETNELRTADLVADVAGQPHRVRGTNLLAYMPTKDKAVLPIQIPCYDGTGSVTHLDVLSVPEGWNGYRYWMSYTPYPDAGREDPSIVCSQDGMNWRVPPGATNPLSLKAEVVAEGWGWNADPDLVLTPQNNLRCYWMTYQTYGTNATLPTYLGHRLYCRESSNGMTWGPRQYLLGETNSGEAGMLSPSVVIDHDGTYLMYYVDRPYGHDPTAQLKYRTSADGLTWGAEGNCTFTTWTNIVGTNALDVHVFPNLWHPNVVRVASNYFMLVMTTTTDGDITFDSTEKGKLYWGTSSNRVHWTFEPVDSIQKSGTPTDLGYFYRSAMVPRPGIPLRWDLWLSGVPYPYMTNQAMPYATNPWDVLHYEDVEMPMRPRQLNAFICPPISLIPAVTNSMPGTNTWIGSRFAVAYDTLIRYVLFEVMTSAGDLELGIYRLFGTQRSKATLVYRSDRFACPAAGQVRKDIGRQLLSPGDYIIYLWASNPSAKFQIEVVRSAYINKLSAAAIEINTMATYMGSVPWTSYAIGGLTMEGDF
jgi:hypothetical protein